MNEWQQFWTWVYIVGLAGFGLVSLIIIPLGFRDLLKLLRELGEDPETMKKER